MKVTKWTHECKKKQRAFLTKCCVRQNYRLKDEVVGLMHVKLSVLSVCCTSVYERQKRCKNSQLSIKTTTLNPVGCSCSQSQVMGSRTQFGQCLQSEQLHWRELVKQCKAQAVGRLEARQLGAQTRALQFRDEAQTVDNKQKKQHN